MELKNTKIIAEVSSNHSGDMFLAKEFIRITSLIGADYVKFQSSRYEDLSDKDDSQAAWIKKTSLSDEDHLELLEACNKNNIRFLTTCFSIKRIPFLASLGLQEIKVASPDLLSYAMIEKLSETFSHLILSTGMHSIKEIKTTIDFLLKNQINSTLLHSVSLYPTRMEQASMYKFLWLKDHFPKVGYSNHVGSIEPIKFAMNHGAEIIESHIKLGSLGPGRTTVWDILPEKFKEVVEYRNTLVQMLGDPVSLSQEDFLLPEEEEAKVQFVGRWGDNRFDTKKD
ncbi:MAG: N-acetylneuraminate synthase family protein [Thermodesulfobacteriota bacterium]